MSSAPRLAPSGVNMIEQRAARAQSVATFRYSRLLNALLWLTIAFSSFTFIEPSPYDILLLLLWVTWFFSGFRLHRSIVPAVAFLFLHDFLGLLALLPHLDETDGVTWFYYSIYMLLALFVSAALFAEDSERRTDMLLQGYVVAALLASVLAIIGYFDLFGSEKLFSPGGRAMGPFKDPNVYGSFTIPVTLFLLRRLFAGQARSALGALATVAVMLTILFGLFLSFSRGSWGATVAATAVMTGLMFFRSRSARERGRIALMLAIMSGAAVVGVGAALSTPKIGDMFASHVTQAQDYDSGETGRFGNQKRSIPYILDNPFGMGPLGFRRIFGIEPHNSYVGAFANFGWLGGVAFILWVGSSCFVGFRLCWLDSPYRNKAQILWPPVFAYFLQAFQIDIDHWRFVYLLLGAVWGLEAARQKWAARRAPSAAPVSAQPYALSLGDSPR